MTFTAGVVVGVLGTLLVSTVAGLLLARAIAEPRDPAAEELWAEPWPPAPITDLAPTAAEQHALPVTTPEQSAIDVEDLIREVEGLIRRKARS